MKRIFQTVMVMCAVLVIAGSAWSYSVTIGSDIIDVGGLDTIITSDTLKNSGDATELAWVQTETGDSDLVMDAKYTIMDWLETDAAGVYAIDLRYDPAYFLVKLGKGAASGDDHFLFENSASLDWGVVDLTAMGLSIDNIGGISHVGEFKGTTSVPEPMTALLLGLGLLGLGGTRRFLK